MTCVLCAVWGLAISCRVLRKTLDERRPANHESAIATGGTTETSALAGASEGRRFAFLSVSAVLCSAVLRRLVLRCIALRCVALHCVASCRVVSCRVVSCRVVSCRVVSCRVVSCRVVSWRVVSCRVVSCRVVSCRVVSCRVVSCRVVSCRVVSCRAVSCCAVLCCAVLPYVGQSVPLSHAPQLTTSAVSAPACFCPCATWPSPVPCAHIISLMPTPTTRAAHSKA